MIAFLATVALAYSAGIVLVAAFCRREPQSRVSGLRSDPLDVPRVTEVGRT